MGRDVILSMIDDAIHTGIQTGMVGPDLAGTRSVEEAFVELKEARLRTSG